MELRRVCERHDCRKLYPPSDSNQKYCTPYCANLAVQRRRRKREANRKAQTIRFLVYRYNNHEIDAKELSYQIHQLGKY